MGKTLSNTDASRAKDLKIWGDKDMFKLLCKASSEKERWVESTKAMEVPGGCIVQVTTLQKNSDNSYAVAEALGYVPDVVIFEKYDEYGKVNARQLDSEDNIKMREKTKNLRDMCID